MKEFFRFGLIGLVIGLGVGLALAGWSNPTGPPTDLAGTNAPEPINVGPATQTKTGQLIINGFLTAPTIFTGKLGIGPGAVISFDPFAVLDVDGRVRIRGGNPQANGILTAVNNLGLAVWKSYQSIIALYEGNGIDLTPNTIIPTSGTIAINDAYTQRRVGPTCAAGQEIYSISQTGVASCRPATISLTAGTGLTATPVNPITNAGTISINPLVTQQRVSGTCAVGQTISAIAQDGTVTCRPATVSLTPGTGITLTPNPITNTGTVAINPAVTQQRVSGGCLITGGIRAINADGTVVCGSCN